MAASKTDIAWRDFGKNDPYFGVLSQPRFRRDAMTEADRAEFFRTGEQHVSQVIEEVRSRVGGPDRFKTALDFGCGVGRLAIPLASHAEQVVGVDISDDMLAEAERNRSAVRLQNLSLLNTEEWLSGDDRYDLVHSFIVLQHIPPRQGMRLLSTLVDRVAPGGVGVLHLTYGKNLAGARWINWAKKRVPLVRQAINVARGRRFNAPMMQMNDYDMNRVLQLLQDKGVTGFHTWYTDHGGYLGVVLFFNKPGSIAESGLAA